MANQTKRRNSIEYLLGDDAQRRRKEGNPEEEAEYAEASLKDLLMPLIGVKNDALSRKMYEVYTEKYEDKILDLKVKQMIRQRLMKEIELEFTTNEGAASKKDPAQNVSLPNLQISKKKSKAKQKEQKDRGKQSHQKFEKLREKIIPEESQKQIEKSKYQLSS